MHQLCIPILTSCKLRTQVIAQQLTAMLYLWCPHGHVEYLSALRFAQHRQTGHPPFTYWRLYIKNLSVCSHAYSLNLTELTRNVVAISPLSSGTRPLCPSCVSGLMKARRLWKKSKFAWVWRNCNALQTHVCVALCCLATKQCDAAYQERLIRTICCGPTVTTCQGHAASATTCSLLDIFEASCNFREIVKHLYKQNFHPNSIHGHFVSNLIYFSGLRLQKAELTICIWPCRLERTCSQDRYFVQCRIELTDTKGENEDCIDHSSAVWFQTSATKKLRTALFWVITERVVVISYREKLPLLAA